MSRRTATLAAFALAVAGLVAPSAGAAPPDPSYVFVEALGVTGSTQVLFPQGIEIVDDTMFVADPGNARIWIEDLETGDVSFATHPDLSSETASRLAVHDGELYVPSYEGNHILVFGLDGTYRRDIPGVTGVGPDAYTFGRGIDVAPDGTIYAIDSVTYSIVVLPPDGEPWFLGEHAAYPGPGQHARPADIAVGPDGSVYVADFDAARVARFRPDGEFVAAFGGLGSAPGKFQYPDSVTVDDAGLVYVSDPYNHRVQAFSADGDFLTSIGPGTGQPGTLFDGWAGGVAFDENGRMYVTNGASTAPSPNPIHRVLAFDPVMTAWSAPYLQGGAAKIGGVLTAQPGVWPGGVTVAWQWLRGGAAIPGATGKTYTPTGADGGHAVAVRVTGKFGSRGSVPVTLTAGTIARASSTVKLAKTKATAGKKPKVKVTVTGPAGAPLTGKVTIKRGSKVLATKTLESSHRGKITISVPKHKVGKYRLTATFAGNSSLLPSSSASSKLTVTKAKPKVKLKLVKKNVARSTKAKIKVTVKVTGIAKPTGKLRVYDGKKRIKTVTLKAKRRGKITVTLPALKAGKHKIKVTYLGTKQIAKTSSKVTVLRVAR